MDLGRIGDHIARAPGRASPPPPPAASLIILAMMAILTAAAGVAALIADLFPAIAA